MIPTRPICQRSHRNGRSSAILSAVGRGTLASFLVSAGCGVPSTAELSVFGAQIAQVTFEQETDSLTCFHNTDFLGIYLESDTAAVSVGVIGFVAEPGTYRFSVTDTDAEDAIVVDLSFGQLFVYETNFERVGSTYTETECALVIDAFEAGGPGGGHVAGSLACQDLLASPNSADFVWGFGEPQPRLHAELRFDCALGLDAEEP